MKLNGSDDLRPHSLETRLPEEVLCKKFLAPFGVTPDGLAEKLAVPIEVAYQIIVGTQAITEDMAGRLASVFRTSPDLWMTIQRGRDRNRI